MSEYQYYEFQAVDRCLTEKEKDELRSFSTRAPITPYSFTKHLCMGNFKDNADLWMEKYFDGFIYYANWGTRCKTAASGWYLDLKIVAPYCDGEYFSARLSQDRLILNFLSESKEYEDFEDFESSQVLLGLFLSLRADLIRGDLHCLYLGWLVGLYVGVVLKIKHGFFV